MRRPAGLLKIVLPVHLKLWTSGKFKLEDMLRYIMVRDESFQFLTWTKRVRETFVRLFRLCVSYLQEFVCMCRKIYKYVYVYIRNSAVLNCDLLQTDA